MDERTTGCGWRDGLLTTVARGRAAGRDVAEAAVVAAAAATPALAGLRTDDGFCGWRLGAGAAAFGGAAGAGAGRAGGRTAPGASA
jgi:hypothetical protein